VVGTVNPLTFIHLQNPTTPALDTYAQVIQLPQLLLVNRLVGWLNLGCLIVETRFERPGKNALFMTTGHFADRPAQEFVPWNRHQ